MNPVTALGRAWLGEWKRLSMMTAALGGALLMTSCAGSSSPTASPAAPAGRCLGTLGLDAGPITVAARKRLGLPGELSGAIVTEVWPDGPATASIRPGDVVEEIGDARVGNDCDFDDAAFNRACGPVRVAVWRSGTRVEATLTPVDQAPFLEQACREGHAGACFREGWLLWSRKGGPNVPRALELFTAACTAGSGRGCAYEAIQLMDEPDRGSDAVTAAERSCQLGDGGGCAHLAFLYATGKFVKKDDHRATGLYVKACDLGDPQGCYNVGLMADEGRGGARDAARAASKYEQACALGSSTGCTNLGFLYEHGRGVRTDARKAVALYQRGCDGTRCQPSNLNGCVNVGRAYRDGIGVEKDEARAAEIFRKACDRPVDRDDSGAAENGSRACSLLGGLYMAGDGIPKDLAKGLELSVLGCDRGDSFGCFNAAALYSAGQGMAPDPAKAARYLDLACKGGDGEGCFDLGVAYEKGNGVAPDRRYASQLFARACQIGFAEACKKTAR